MGEGRRAGEGLGCAVNRPAMLTAARNRRDPWDFIVIGGGATGAGIAVDAATRGHSVLLLERHDFGKGTSSRSTKLVHGGVRYLERGDFKLVMEALRERGRLLRNAPHLVRIQTFVMPCYRWWRIPFYGLGLKLYDLLARRERFGASRFLSRRSVIEKLPTVQAEGLRGGILYFDGQFDDTRLVVNLMQTAAEARATLINYCNVERLQTTSDGTITGVVARNMESGDEFTASARVVVNATGVFCDAVRAMADSSAKPMVVPSQGAHVVLDRSFLPGETALMVPKTPDGRVLFAIPWHGHTVVGTTDVGIPKTDAEPRATDAEIDFILDTAGRYLARKPTRTDVLSVFAGIRPLVRAEGASNTAALSRDHIIRIERGLVTITGGKWTTYRNMAEDCVTRCETVGKLTPKPCRTIDLPVHGAAAETGDALTIYGTDAAGIRELQRDPSLAAPLHPALPYTGAEVVWAARHEMARTVEDVLARRTRALFLNAAAAIDCAPRVAELLAAELGFDTAWVRRQIDDFTAVARGYQLSRAH